MNAQICIKQYTARSLRRLGSCCLVLDSRSSQQASHLLLDVFRSDVTPQGRPVWFSTNDRYRIDTKFFISLNFRRFISIYFSNMFRPAHHCRSRRSISRCSTLLPNSTSDSLLLWRAVIKSFCKVSKVRDSKNCVSYICFSSSKLQNSVYMISS